MMRSGGVLQDDVDQAIGARVRKRIEHDVAQDAVDDREEVNFLLMFACA